MITEDYCSFKIAKLLKKKGFDWECISYYVDDEPDDVKYSFCGETNSDWESRCCSAPTLQMAMKWLVQEYKLYVNVAPSVEGYYWTDKWNSYVENLNKRYPFGRFISTFNSYEEACEAAIKYCLENLI